MLGLVCSLMMVCAVGAAMTPDDVILLGMVCYEMMLCAVVVAGM